MTTDEHSCENYWVMVGSAPSINGMEVALQCGRCGREQEGLLDISEAVDETHAEAESQGVDTDAASFTLEMQEGDADALKEYLDELAPPCVACGTKGYHTGEQCIAGRSTCVRLGCNKKTCVQAMVNGGPPTCLSHYFNEPPDTVPRLVEPHCIREGDFVETSDGWEQVKGTRLEPNGDLMVLTTLANAVACPPEHRVSIRRPLDSEPDDAHRHPEGTLCERCSRPIEEARRCYVHPVCYACLPPPEPLPVEPLPSDEESEQGA